MTIEEYALADFYLSNEYTNKGIHIEDLSQDEILEIVKDGWNYFILKQTVRKSDLELTKKVKSILKTSAIHKENNSFFNPKWFISSKFLK